MGLDEALTALPAANTPLDDTDVFYIVQQTTSTTTTGVSSKVTYLELKDEISTTGSAITSLTGDVIAAGPGAALANLSITGVTAGSYTFADITVNDKGRLTAASNGGNAKADGATKGIAAFTASDFDDNGSGIISIDYTNGQAADATHKGFLTAADWSTFHIGAAGGTVTQVDTTAPISGGPITTTGTITHDNTAVTPGTYSNATVTVDQKGHVTAASSGTAGAGSLVLVEHQLLTADADLFTFSGLDGNTDGVYLMIGRILNHNVAAQNYFLRMNGVTTNQSARYVTSSNASNTTNEWILNGGSFTVPANGWIAFEAKIWARCNPNGQAFDRFGLSRESHFDGANMAFVDASQRWNDTTTNLTSIDVTGGNLNSCGNGSEVTLYKFAE